MGTLLEWFKTQREVNIIKGTQDHAKKVYDTVFELNKTIKKFFEGKVEEISAQVKRVNELEHECDAIRRKIMLDLSKGEIAPTVREDLAHLIKRLDLVANNANASAKRLSLLTPEILEPIASEIIEMSETTLKCANVLYKTIAKQLGESTAKIFESITEIHQLEHEVDVIIFNIKKKLIESNLNHPTYVGIIVYELINTIENISDNAEETADFVKIVKVRQ